MTSPSDRAVFSRALVALLAVGAGVSVASIYYNQPLLDRMARDLGVSPAAIGALPTLTQLGYASGLFLFAPLGDRFDLRRVILIKGAFLAGALAVLAIAQSVWALGAASLVVGLLATTAQDYVPAAAAIAPPAARGKTIGTAMTGLLLGILLSRVVSGVVGDLFGWRTVFVGAALTVALLTLVARKTLPPLPPAASAGYGALLRSMAGLFRKHAPLRRAALAQSLLSVAFSGFWSTLALVLARPPFEHGSAVAGAFGLAGAAGALIAPVAGAMADKRGPETIVRIGAMIVLASFVAMAIAPGSMVVLVVATITFDLGIQASLISHQTIVYGLDAGARSRLNALLVTSMFLGMALGSALASRLLQGYGFRGVCALATFATLAAIVARGRGIRAKST